ncbi:hypothetical protein D3C87_1374080 [compost metagenome]
MSQTISAQVSFGSQLQYPPQASAAQSAPRIVAMVKNAKPTAMALYMTSSSSSSEGSRSDRIPRSLSRYATDTIAASANVP